MPHTVCLWFAVRQFYRGTTSIARAVNMLTLLGIALGLGVLITLISVERGLETWLINKNFRYMPHAWLTPTPEAHDQRPVLPPTLQRDTLAIEPSIMGEVFLIGHHRFKKAQLVSLMQNDPLLELSIAQHRGSLNEPPLLLGVQLAQELQVGIGDFIRLYPIEKINENSMTNVQLLTPLRITGVIYSGSRADSAAVLVSCEQARRLLSHPPTAWRLTLKRPLTPPTPLLDPVWQWHDWQEHQPTLAQAIRLAQRTLQLLLLTLLLICFLNILTGQGLTVLSKTSDIAILKCLGCSERDLMTLFFVEGLFTLLLGILLGLGVGGSLLALVRFLLPKFDLQATLIPPLYVMLLDPKLQRWILILLLVTSLGILNPARKASRASPIKALCHE